MFFCIFNQVITWNDPDSNANLYGPQSWIVSEISLYSILCIPCHHCDDPCNENVLRKVMRTLYRSGHKSYQNFRPWNFCKLLEFCLSLDWTVRSLYADLNVFLGTILMRMFLCTCHRTIFPLNLNAFSNVYEVNQVNYNFFHIQCI